MAHKGVPLRGAIVFFFRGGSRWVNGKCVTILFFIAIAVMKERKLLAENLWVLYLCTDREPKKAFVIQFIFGVDAAESERFSFVSYSLNKLFTLDIKERRETFVE